MLVPLGLLAIGAVFAGYVFHHAFIEEEGFWNGAIHFNEHLIHAMHEVPLAVKLSATIVMLLGFTIAWYGYIRNTSFPAAVAEQLGPVYRFIYRKWMFDDLYHYLFVVPAFYALLAKYTSSPEALAHQLDTLEANTPQAGGHA